MSRRKRRPGTTDAAHTDVVRCWTVAREKDGWVVLELEVPAQTVQVVSRAEPDPLGVALERLGLHVHRAVQDG